MTHDIVYDRRGQAIEYAARITNVGGAVLHRIGCGKCRA